MFYIGLFLYLLAGIVSIARPKEAIVFFFTLAALWPTGNAFIEMNYQSGVFVTDPFWIGLTIRLLYSSKGYPAKLLLIGSATTLIYILYLSSTLLLFPERGNDYILKDFRPLILILQTCIFAIIMRKLTFSRRLLNRVVLVGTATFFLEFSMLSFGFYETKDGFFKEEAFRYLDGSTYLAALFLIWYLTDNLRTLQTKKTKFIAIGAMLSILAAGSRVVIAALAVAAIVFSRGLRSKMLSIAFVFLLIGLFFWVSHMLGVTRVIESIQIQGLLLQFGTRFGPAIQELVQQDTPEKLLGCGLGATFEIPWLEYLGYSSTSVSIDSTYLTLFYKFGITSIPIVMVMLYLPTSDLPKVTRRSFSLFLAIIFLVSALPYQSYGIIINAFIILVSRTPASNDQIKAKTFSRHSIHRPSVNI